MPKYKGADFACQGIFCIEKQGLAMLLGEGGGASALLRNQLTFWSSHLSKRHFWAQFRQTSPACLFFTTRHACG